MVEELFSSQLLYEEQRQPGGFCHDAGDHGETSMLRECPGHQQMMMALKYRARRMWRPTGTKSRFLDEFM